MLALLAALAALLEVLALYAYSRRFPPSWSGKLATPWARVTAWALLGGVLGGGATAAAYHSLPPLPLFATALGGASLGFAGAQSLITDPEVRLVDRRVLYLATLPPLLLHLLALLQGGGGLLLTSWLVTLAVCGALVLLPLVGPSDGRAFLLAAAASFPTVGLRGFTWGLVGFLLLVLLYSLWRAHREATAGPRPRPTYWKSFTRRASVPAVPLILLPFAVLLPLLAVVTP